MSPDPEKPAPPPPSDVPPLETFFKGNRPLTAAALILLLEAVPVAGLVIAMREGGGVWMVFASVLMAGALLPPVGVFLGQKWGFLLGQYVVWGSLVGVILRVLHTGFAPLYLAPAVLLGVLLVALSTPRAAAETRRTEKKPESFGVWLKENIEAIVIAFIMALVIRCFCIEVFKIPSSSMEPTLLGDIGGNHSRLGCPFGPYHVPIPQPGKADNASGDRIMVTKYYYSFSAIERYDVLVFKFPLNQAKNFIKRVVGLPGEELQIHRGNLYTRKLDDPGPFQIARRTLRTQDSLWIDPAKGTAGYLASAEAFNGHWLAETPPGRKEGAHVDVKDGVLSTLEKGGERSAVFAYSEGGQKYLDDDDNSNNVPVDDVRILFEFELTSPKGQIFAEIVNAYGRFEARLDTEGESQLICSLPTKEGKNKVETIPLKDIRLQADRTYKLELAIFDGTAVVRLNDGERGKWPFITTKEDLATTESPERRIAFGSRGATFKARNLTLGRDIYYKGRASRDHGLAEDSPVKILPGHYLMMGDNVANSHDSRAWVKRTFVLKDGRKIVCESQQVNEGVYKIPPHIKETLDPKDVVYWIDGDQHGNELAILKSQEPKEDPPSGEEFRLVEEKYIVGKALWIWWPQGRWFHLIR
jgi:signal peptidase I